MRFRFFLLCLLLIVHGKAVCQSDDSLVTDTLALPLPKPVYDTISGRAVIINADSLITALFPKGKSLLVNNRLLYGLPEAIPIFQRAHVADRPEFIFYVIIGIALLLGILRLSFARYFQNMFRVFFNTSLRQKQLTDQLLQTPLPSLLFNLLFFFSAAMLIYLLLGQSGRINAGTAYVFYAYCCLALTSIYFFKFLLIRFAGWLTGFSVEAGQYVFIVFLVNKIIGIFLLPLLPLIAFSESAVAHVATIVSLMLVLLLTSLRFLRTYGLTQYGLKISRFHFIIYILGIEILPILLLYRLALFFLDKNL